MRDDTARWLVKFRPKREPTMRLFCFPHAGGAATVFRSWLDYLPDGYELNAVQLPGRGFRFREAPETNLARLADALTAAVQGLPPAPFAFFGHSLGALLAFEVSRRLQVQQSPLPTHLFVSGCRAPQLPPSTWAGLHQLSDVDLLNRIRQLNGTPADILNNPELMALMLPALRADFAAFETYRYVAGPPMRCPVTAWVGTEDPLLPQPVAVAAWQAQTVEAFALRRWPGDHFYLHDDPGQLVAAVVASLTQNMI